MAKSRQQKTGRRIAELSLNRLAGALCGLVLCGVVLCGAGQSLASAAPASTLPVLQTTEAAHSLSLEQAARGYPVRLRAVVTYYDPYIDPRRAALFIHDATGSVFVALASPLKTPLRAGSVVEVTGTTADGDFAPIVDHAAIHVVGASHVPAQGQPATMSQMLTGQLDGQWVQVEGVVHSVTESGTHILLDMATSEGPIKAITLKQPDTDYSHLVDARIEVRANEAPLFNRRRQLTGVHLFFPSLDEVRIVEPPASDPFTLPVVPIDRVLQYEGKAAFRHRVHVRGVVTLEWPGRSLCIQDSTQGLCVETTQAGTLADGTLADVVGFPVVGGLTPTFTDAAFRPAGPGKALRATVMKAEQGLSGDHDAELVQMDGKLIGKDRGANDLTMVLSDGKFLFPVILPAPPNGTEIPDWQDGSTLRITGICSVNVDPNKAIHEGFSIPASFRILLRSPADVAVLKKPSWLTAAHLLPFLILVLVATLCVLGWVAVLRQRISQQSALILQQNVTLMGFSFEDGLTHLANRRKFDEALERELDRASRASTSLALLMIDIDHFKALNDACGHQRGDECLMQIAGVLTGACLRASDLIARYGGEEFAVILPLCDEAGAYATAERMRAAVLDLAIPHPHSPFSQRVSISVGVASVLPTSCFTAASLIALADQALYQSKTTGRNRTTCTRSGSIPPLLAVAR